MKIFPLSILFSIFLPLASFSQPASNSIWSGFLSLGGYYQSGNTNKLYVQSKGEVKRADNVLESILNVSYGYGESNRRKDDNNIISTFTADLFYEKTISPFLLQIIQYDFKKGIDLRSQSGGGIKYIFIPFKKHKSSISLALIYDYTNLVDKPGNYDSEKLRFSLRLKTKQILLDSRLILSFVGFYQPEVNNLSNSNYRIESTMEIPITKTIFLNVTYLYTEDDVVSVSRKRADTKLTFGLGVGFGD